MRMFADNPEIDAGVRSLCTVLYGQCACARRGQGRCTSLDSTAFNLAKRLSMKPERMLTKLANSKDS